MSRTGHHRDNNRQNGESFGFKYKCNRNYCSGIGPIYKWIARRERRNTDKKLIRLELNEVRS